MHCKRGSDDLTKERDAHAFAKKYMDDIPGFIKFIAESDFSVCEGYKESWNKAKIHSSDTQILDYSLKRIQVMNNSLNVSICLKFCGFLEVTIN